MPLISKLVKGVGRGIGAASEAIQHNKDRRAAAKNSQGESLSTSAAANDEKAHDDDSTSDSEDEEGALEAAWALDEAAVAVAGPKNSSLYEIENPQSRMGAGDLPPPYQMLSDPNDVSTYTDLPYPVILPQRRPQDKARGFIRAYAPVLGDCKGISAGTFLDFLEELDKSSKANPIFDVINLAAFAVGFIPDPIVMAVTTAVNVAATAGKEMQSRYRGNTYIDKKNEEFFKPRGLYCMIMMFKPEQSGDVVFSADLSSADRALVRASSTQDAAAWKQKLHKIRLVDGKTEGEMTLPQAAPLVYPDLDQALSKDAKVSQQEENALKSTMKYLNTYLDHRAQDTYAGTYSDSKLSVPNPSGDHKYASRFSDPNHAANSGTILGLLTGGHFDPKANRRVSRATRRASRRGEVLNEQQIQNIRMGRAENAGSRQDRLNNKPIRKVVKKVLGQNILYLTIVNLPSEAQMAEMRQYLELERQASA